MSKNVHPASGETPVELVFGSIEVARGVRNVDDFSVWQRVQKIAVLSEPSLER
jgi:hypothetical protein